MYTGERIFSTVDHLAPIYSVTRKNFIRVTGAFNDSEVQFARRSFIYWNKDVFKPHQNNNSNKAEFL